MQKQIYYCYLIDKNLTKYIQIKFIAGLQIIYNALAGIISEEIKNQLNGEMGQQIVKTLCDQLLKLLTQQSEVSKFNYDQNISTDQRYFDGITIKDNMLSVWFQGYKCDHSNTDSTCFGYSQTNISRRKTFYTNHDVQYQIEKYAFNSGFWLYLYQERIFNGIKIENITLKRFFNMGAQVIAQLDVNGTKDSLEFLEPVVFTRSAIPDHVYIGKFAIRLTNLIGNTILSQNQLASLSQYFDNRFSLYDISYTNALAVSETQVDYIYLDENWIHIGSNIE
uniref:Uncharacterized protein n=2 Tax=Spironucleus salmonicida TaxID=348837 RepID=V6LGD3_9EUKA|eukprot:EST42731.1 Hypothetical protein SS50377_17653 [Spironucleus salmonicida]